MWTEPRLPPIFERMIGCSIPVDGEVAIISYEGIHLVNLHRPESVHHDLGIQPDVRQDKLLYKSKTYSILGLQGGTPILKSVQGDHLEILAESGRLLVHTPGLKRPIESSFEDLSGDWCLATFSTDGSWIVLGVPYDLIVFRRDL